MSEADRPIDSNPSNGGEPVPPIVEPDIPASDEDEDDEEVYQDSDDDDEDDEDEDEEDFVELLPEPVKLRVTKMKELNKARAAIIQDYLIERAALEQKFLNLYQPLYDERAEIVNGMHDVDISMSAKKGGDGINSSEKNGNSSDNDEEGQLKGVPEFWACAIANIETIAELITERDNECLYHLEDIKCQDFEDGKGFTLSFHFKEDNPFFTNRVLTKRYEVPNLLLDDEPILKNVEGCEIDWKSTDVCLTHKEVTRKQRSKSGRRAGQIRTIKKKERCDSFFHFFIPPKMPQKSVEEIDEEEADAIEEAFDHDYDVAQSFRSHIIPKAVLWFTGEAMQEEIETMIGLNGGEFVGGSAAYVPANNRTSGTSSGTGGGGSSPFPPSVSGSEEPECKQN